MIVNRNIFESACVLLQHLDKFACFAEKKEGTFLCLPFFVSVWLLCLSPCAQEPDALYHPGHAARDHDHGPHHLAVGGGPSTAQVDALEPQRQEKYIDDQRGHGQKHQAPPPGKGAGIQAGDAVGDDAEDQAGAEQYPRVAQHKDDGKQQIGGGAGGRQQHSSLVHSHEITSTRPSPPQ